MNLKKIIKQELERLVKEIDVSNQAMSLPSASVEKEKDLVKSKPDSVSILDQGIAEKCDFCLKPENSNSPECIEWFASEPGGYAGALARCEQSPESPAYKSKKVRAGCGKGLGVSGIRLFRSELRKQGIKTLSTKNAAKMLQVLLNYVNPALPGGAGHERMVVDGVLGRATRKSIQFFQEKTPGMKIDQCAGSGTLSAALKQYYKKYKGSNISYLYRDATRGEGTTIDSKGEVLPAFQALPSQIHNQLEHVQKYLKSMKSNFIIVDDANRRLYVFNPKESYPGSGPQMLAAMPVITGLHKGDRVTHHYAKFFEDFGLLRKYARIKKKAEETGDERPVIEFTNKAFSAWLQYLNKHKNRRTSSAIWSITSVLKTQTKKDKAGYGKAIVYIRDPKNPESAAAIHGTGVKARIRQLQKAGKVFDLDPNNSKIKAIIKKVGSYGCINVGARGLEKLSSLINPSDSQVFVLPEDSTKILNYDDFLDFKKASDGARDKYFKKLSKAGVYNASAASLLAKADSSKIEQVDPEDAFAVKKAMGRAGIGTTKDFTSFEKDK